MNRIKSYVLSFSIILLCFSVYESYSQSKNTQKAKGTDDINNTVVATVGNETITFGELEKAFRKNMNRRDVKLSDVSRDSIIDFLNLYMNYRLKVQDAIRRGYDKDSAVIEDVNQNRKVLAENFFYEKMLVEPNVQYLTKLRDYELQIAIILISLPTLPNADTTIAFQKAKKTLELVKSGKDFSLVAMDSSDDKESSKRGGLIPTYITAGKVQRPIENAIYSLKPGEIYNDLVYTKYGYFIVKLLDKVKREKVKGSHILIATNPSRDSLETIKKADSIYALVKKGADFKILAEENSDDPSSAIKGGDLGSYYSRSSGFDGNGRHMVPEFEKALFSLKNGQLSGKVVTDYGIHIIRRDSSYFVDASTEADELKKIYKRLYYEFDKRNFLDSLRKTNGYELKENIYNELLSSLDTNVTNLDSVWQSKVPSKIMNDVLFKVLDYKATVKDFVNKISNKNDYRGLALNDKGLKSAINKIVDPIVFENATKNLERDYPEFSSLMKEFNDGILLFKIEALEVWDKWKFDSVMAKVYYDTTKLRYKTEPVYEITEIYTLSDSAANDLYKKITNEKQDFSQLAENNTQRAGYREKKGYWGKVSPKTNKLAQLAKENSLMKGDISKPLAFEKGFSIIKIDGYEPVRQKTFEEAIPDLAPDFQDLMQKNLTEKWLNTIKKDLKVQINTSNLDKALNELKKSKKN